MDFDFGSFIARILVVVFVASSGWFAMTLSPATYDGPGQRGESGMVVAGSGDELANASAPAADFHSDNADQWQITTETMAATEEPTDPAGLTNKITPTGGNPTVALIAEAICIACVIIMLAIVAMLWVVVRKEFMNG